MENLIVSCTFEWDWQLGPSVSRPCRNPYNSCRLSD